MNFLSDVVGAGFKGALIRFFRLLFFAIIVLIVVYVVGIFTNKKASALVIKDQVFLPQPSSTSQTFFFRYNAENHWFDFNFNTNWTNTSDFDLVGLRFKKLAYIGDTLENQSPYNFSLVDNSFTMTAVLWDSNDNAHLCYSTSELDNMFLCPITKNTSYKGFSIVGNVAYIATPDFTLRVSIEFEQNANFYNFDSTDIINYMEQNGNIQIIQQQQQTNNILSNGDTTTSQQNSTNALSGIQTTMESKLKGTNELTQMVMAPLTILTNVSSASCTPIQWHIPLVNYDATIPCMSTIYSTHFSQILALFSTIITGVFAYRTVVKLVSTIKDSLDAENDKLEVLDL